jgi:hypothetical protein
MTDQARPRLTLFTVTCTNEVSPSSWEGVTEDGRTVCIRYLFDRLAVCVAGMMLAAYDGIMWRTGVQPWFEQQVGYDCDGFMELRDACRTARILIALGALRARAA